MVAVMATFIGIFVSGLDSPDVIGSLRSGIVAGLASAVIIATFAYYMMPEVPCSGRYVEAIRAQELNRVQATPSPIRDSPLKRSPAQHWTGKKTVEGASGGSD